MYSFLLVGQSNMAGRGFPHEVEPIAGDDLYMLRNGRWQHMFVPVHPDRSFSGICLGESFAEAYAKLSQEKVGLIPCADGGTSLDQWAPGGVLYDHAVFQAKLAMRSSELIGILWHQGEADCAETRYPFYEEKCTRILCSMREELGLPDLPVLLGGLGDFLPKRLVSPNLVNYGKVNEALMSMAKNQKNFAYVPADGLGSNPDNLHFSAAALREFGLRYFEVFKTMDSARMHGSAVAEDVERSEMEKL